MNIDNSLQKVQGGHHFHRHAQMVDGGSQDPATPVKRHRHHDHDELRLSDAAKTAGTRKLDLDPEKTLNVEQQLSIQIFSQMFKRVTGQELPITAPADLPAQDGPVSAQLPQQPPATQASPDAGATYQQTASFFQAQIITFNAEGSISTKDGQSVKFNVSLSMSRLFYSQATLDQTQLDPGQDQPLHASFQGLAAELTTTSFSFSIDQGGSLDQLGSRKPATPPNAPAANSATNATPNVAAKPDSASNPPINASPTATTTAEKDDDGDDSRHKLLDQLHDLEESLFHLAKQLFKAMRIWQQHQDGSQQLMALGDETRGALFVGQHSKPLPATPTNTPDAPTHAPAQNVPDRSPSLQLAA